jgi:O-antigen/teichoic acid export membrane protein
MTASRGFVTILYHFRNYFGTEIATRGLSFVSLIVYANLLTPEEFGSFSVFMSYVGIAAILLTLNMHTALGRYCYEKSDNFNQFFSTSVILTTACLVVASAALLVFGEKVDAMMGVTHGLLVPLIILVLINVSFAIFLQVLQPQRESMKIGKVNVLNAYLGFGTGTALAYALKYDKHLGFIYGQMAVGLLSMAYIIHQLKRYFTFTFEKESLRYILTYSLPLLPYVLCGQVLDQFGRIMINNYAGSADAGLYSFAQNIGMLLSVFISALLTAWTPDYFEDIENKDYSKLNSDIDKMLRLIAFIAAGLILFGGDIGSVMGSGAYRAALYLIPIFVLGFFFTALWQVYGRALGYTRKTYLISFVAITAICINVGLTVHLVPLYGYAAGAYSTLISYVVMAVLAWFFSKYVLKFYTTPLAIIVKPLIILLMLVFLYYGLISLSLSVWLSLFLKVCLLVASGYFMMHNYLKVSNIIEVLKIMKLKGPA